MRRRLTGVVGGLGVAALPALAAAQEVGERAVDPPGDAAAVVLLTVGGVLALFVISAIGYLYRRERGIEWEFQRPEEPHDEPHEGHAEAHEEPAGAGGRATAH